MPCGVFFLTVFRSFHCYVPSGKSGRVIGIVFEYWHLKVSDQ